MGSSSSNVNDGDEIAVTDNGNYIVDLHFKEVWVVGSNSIGAEMQSL